MSEIPSAKKAHDIFPVGLSATSIARSSSSLSPLKQCMMVQEC